MAPGAAAQLATEYRYPATASFIPRQVLTVATPSMRHLSGSATTQLAEDSVSRFPAISPKSVIHDNGCGDGTATRSILSRISDRSAYPQLVWATDIPSAATGIEQLRIDAEERQWPVTTAYMGAESLGIPDNTVTHSIMNSVILRIRYEYRIKAVQETYRTLKPGGVAIINEFGHAPHRPALAAAHAATRPAGTSPPIGTGSTAWEDGSLLRNTIIKGGFKPENIQMVKGKVYIEVDDLDTWEAQTWSILGRPLDGWLVTDEKNWQKATRIFRETLRRQPEVELFNNDASARFALHTWIAIARK